MKPNDFAAKLAERGFITFAPHNLYRGEDRYRWLDRIVKVVVAVLTLSTVAATALVLTDVFLKQYKAIEAMPDGPEKDRALAKFIQVALLSGGLMTLSLKGGIADVRGGKNATIHLDADGTPTLKGADAEGDDVMQRSGGVYAGLAGHTALVSSRESHVKFIS